VKLGDFGLAKDNIWSATEGARSICGTPEYMAPEVLNKVGLWGSGDPARGLGALLLSALFASALWMSFWAETSLSLSLSVGGGVSRWATATQSTGGGSA
jgi:serine/threonine protein kinase